MRKILILILSASCLLKLQGQSNKAVYFGTNLLQIPSLTINANLKYELAPYLSPLIDLGYTVNYSKAFDFIGYIMTSHCKCANDGYTVNRQSGGYIKLGTLLDLRKNSDRKNYPFLGLFLTNSFVHEKGIFLSPEQSVPSEEKIEQTKYIIGLASSLGYEFSLTKRFRSDISFQISLPNKAYKNLYGYRNYIPGIGFKDYERYWFPMLIMNLKYRI